MELGMLSVADFVVYQTYSNDEVWKFHGIQSYWTSRIGHTGVELVKEVESHCLFWEAS